MAGPKRPKGRRPASFVPKPREKAAPSRPPPPAAPPRRPAPSAPRVPPRHVEEEPEPDLVEEAKKGSSGRSLSRSAADVPAAPVDDTPALPPGVSPFAQYNDGVEMAGHLERGQADTVRIVAIMVGLLFVVGSMMVLSGAVVVAGLAWTGQFDEAGDVASDGSDDPRHIRDTGLQKGRVIEAPQRRGGGRAAPKPDEAPAPVAPQPAPVSVVIPAEMLFHEVEISCPSGWRGRARLKGGRATVKAVPPGMECRLTFKGSEPAQTKCQAGQTVQCTFHPTKCFAR